MLFERPPLPYDYNALVPYVNEAIMKVHHTKHHQGYVDKLNKAIAGTPLQQLSITDILSQVSQHSAAVRNNAGGHYNHSLFWTILSPKGAKHPSGVLAEAIKQQYGSFEEFKQAFTQAANTHFGSGWAWLCVNKQGHLFICTTPNQDNPLMDVVPKESQGTPILALDVWEHAYYLQYQNRRPEYVESFWHIINWMEVERRFIAARNE